MPQLPGPERHRPDHVLQLPAGVPGGVPGLQQPRRIQGDGVPADVLAVALRERHVGQRGGLRSAAAVPPRRDETGRHQPQDVHDAGGGVPGGTEGRTGEGRQVPAAGHHGCDAAEAGRAPQPVRPPAARERADVQRLRALVPAGAHRHVERLLAPHGEERGWESALLERPEVHHQVDGSMSSFLS